VIEMWKADAPRPAASAPTNAQVIAKATELAAAAGRPGRHTEFVVKARAALTDAAAQPSPREVVQELTAKRGARNSAEDLARIQAAHDEPVALGARCDHGDDEDDQDQADEDPDDLDEDEDDGEGDDDDADKALHAGAVTAGLAQQIQGLRRTVVTLQKRLDQVSAEPRAPKTVAGWARAITKAEDASASPADVSAEDLRKYLDSLPPEERGRLELRAALSRPIVGR
jgi:hypothetical protein